MSGDFASEVQETMEKHEWNRRLLLEELARRKTFSYKLAKVNKKLKDNNPLISVIIPVVTLVVGIIAGHLWK